MKKALITVAVLSAVSGMAYAQSNVEIYGLIDVGVAKSSVDAASPERVFGSAGPNAPTATSNPSAINDKLRMTEKYSSRIGLRGTENLGGGLKATFQLEKRFKPYDGSKFNATGLEFEGASNVGLAGSFGAVRLGRMNNALNETIRAYDPFAEFGVASHLVTAVSYTRQSNTVRYDSPNFNGFDVSASYELKNEDTAGPANAPNEGYGAVVRYNNGPLSLSAGYDKRANYADSDQWSIGGSYAFGPAKVSFIYDDSNRKALNASDIEQKNFLLGLAYKVGAGTVNASYQHLKWEQQGQADRKDQRYGLGYTHDLSKRTSLYAEYSVTTGDNVKATSANDDSYNAVSVGMTHKF